MQETTGQPLAGKTAAFLSLGCKVNSYETEAMRRLFEEAGARTVDFDDAADFYVVNTCTVTNIADRKSRQMLHRAKKRNPDGVVVAAGCYVQAAEQQVREDCAVDVLVGNQQKREIVALVLEYLEGRRARQLADVSREREYEELGFSAAQEKTRAFIKIQDGCNQFCTYCIIPFARGRIRSRREEEILAEAERLTAQGYREIVLTGIHLSSYGFEAYPEKQRFELRIPGEQAPLLALIRKLDRVPGLERIRLGSLEPRIITEELAAELAGTKVCPHFHLSLQSGCDATLARMNRRYNTQDYRESCGILRRHFENPAITTDVIVGFPGETEEEFAVTRRFLEEIGFAQMHIFKYSRRKGTKAADMPGQIPEPEKTRRSEELLALEQRLRRAYEDSFAGRTTKILFEEAAAFSGQTYMTGHNERYVRFAVRTGEDWSNRILACRVSEHTVGGQLREAFLCGE
ncbi:MAG: tRNA (N(6)-L-threonylcarbamoyladenosine(37)-C(2))-methylthiotransferase MtaB [Lachnospiraceae bacterium]|nr:tRNA (N(6)-L-threonylcarbamoyladenosine(37)-C(2))-methylthiotransferase MtaB [Lachnospiraceae bacterium]